MGEQTVPVHPIGSRQDLEAEIDAILADLRALRGKVAPEPDHAMAWLAAHSARVTELMVHLHRLETRWHDPDEYRQIRTMQLSPLMEELDRQFKVASREIEMRRQDLEHAK